jgi:pimeloyl-ACP methyl ester carboxylesterase
MPTVSVDGVDIAYDVAGEGEPCLLLHGWPDSASLWRNQVPALVDAGYRVVTPDLRGYGRSSKPTEVDAYSILVIAGDLVAVLDDLGLERVNLVGHDWGAGIAWAMAAFLPDRVQRLVVLSVGAPGTFFRTYEQREKSWYMLLFQFEGIAEQWLRDDGWANFRAWANHPDADEVIARLEADGSLTPGLNYYRANVGPATLLAPPPELPPVQAPTMGLWSTGDLALTETQMTDSSKAVAGTFRYERVEGPGHWMQLEAPERVNALLLDFLRG